MATCTLTTTATGFLGVTSPEHREAGLEMPISALITRISERLREQAVVSRRATALIALGLEYLPNDSDTDKAEALISALQPHLKDLDDGLCEFGGYFEALIVRAKEASRG